MQIYLFLDGLIQKQQWREFFPLARETNQDISY